MFPQPPLKNEHQTFIIEEFEPDVFRQLIEYIHTGSITLQPRTLLGVMNAADYYGTNSISIKLVDKLIKSFLMAVP